MKCSGVRISWGGKRIMGHPVHCDFFYWSHEFFLGGKYLKNWTGHLTKLWQVLELKYWAMFWNVWVLVRDNSSFLFHTEKNINFKAIFCRAYWEFRPVQLFAIFRNDKLSTWSFSENSPCIYRLIKENDGKMLYLLVFFKSLICPRLTLLYY